MWPEPRTGPVNATTGGMAGKWSTEFKLRGRILRLELGEGCQRQVYGAYSRLVTLITDNQGRDGVWCDGTSVRFQTILLLNFPGQRVRVNASTHEEPLLSPFCGNDLLVIEGKIEAEEDAGGGVFRVGSKAGIFRRQNPGRGWQEDSRECLCVEPLDAMLMLIGKPGRAVCLDGKHHGHITARVCLAVEGLTRIRRAIADRSRSGHGMGERYVSDNN